MLTFLVKVKLVGSGKVRSILHALELLSLDQSKGSNSNAGKMDQMDHNRRSYMRNVHARVTRLFSGQHFSAIMHAV